MVLVAGVDSSTQSCKVLVVDADSGAVVGSGRAAHPDGTEVDPSAWWQALSVASDGLLDGVAAVSVAGQQHGLVPLDDRGAVVRPALLWNDTRSAAAAADLVAELGADTWAAAVGSVPVASFTVAKLRWLATAEPHHADRVAGVLLPHDWLTWQLLGRPAQAVTDRGDASGTGYWSPATGTYRPDLLAAAFGREVAVPRVLGPYEAAGSTAGGIVVGPGTGDNMGAALGLGLVSGELAISVGTSGVVSAVHDLPAADATGFVAGFCDATGRWLPLACTLNGARVLVAAAQLLGTDLAGLDRLALEAQPGAGGLTLLPYLDGERTPNLPAATGTMVGLTRANATPANLARAAVEGLLCSLADGVAALTAVGLTADRALLLGGGSGSRALVTLAPDLLGMAASVPEPAEYVALGAARQAAWVLAGTPAPPSWALPRSADVEPGRPDVGAEVLDRYRTARLATFGV